MSGTEHVHRDARVLGLTLALRDNRHLLSNQYFWLGIGSQDTVPRLPGGCLSTYSHCPPSTPSLKQWLEW